MTSSTAVYPGKAGEVRPRPNLDCHMPAGLFARLHYLRQTRRDTVTDRLKLQRLCQAHQGRRAFILGNAPSIGRMDLARLRHEVTFAVNGAYLLYPKMGCDATYTCFTDRIAWFDHRERALQASPTSQFFYCDDWEYPTPPTLFTAEQRGRLILLDQSYIVPFWCAALAPMRNRAGFYTYSRLRRRRFSRDPRRGVVLGISCIFTAIQLAAYMGCSPIILLGVEMDYSGKETHFHGLNVKVPDLDYERDAKPWFLWCRDALERSGTELLNATLGGKVNDVPRICFEDLFPS